MRDLEIDMTNPNSPVLWIKGTGIMMYNWHKTTATKLIQKVGIYGRKREKGKEFYRQYGVLASNAAKFFNNGLIKMSLGAMPGHEQLFFRGKNFCSANAISACKMKDELDQALKDGNRHITPLMVFFEESPQQLKKRFSGSVWKSLCKNTFTRNRLICDNFRNNGENVKELLDVPSGILKHQSLSRGYEIHKYIYEKVKIPIVEMKNGATNYKEVMQIILDTKRMANRFGLSFSLDWSWRRMREEHDNYTIELNNRHLQKELETDKKYKDIILRQEKQKVWTTDGEVTAIFLDTYESILQEGIKMRHCVGGYASMCCNGTYAVVHISGDGEESTLGIDIHGTTHLKKYSLSQHYTAGNQPVKSDKHKLLAEVVIFLLNQEKELIKMNEMEVA